MAEKRHLAAQYTAPQQQLLPQQQLPPQGQQVLYQQPLLSQQQPMVIQIRRSPAKRYDKFQTTRSRALGICQIVCGVLAVVLNAVGWGIHSSAERAVSREHDNNNDFGYGRYYWDPSIGYYISTGFWCTVFFFISGAFAISAAKRPTKCLVVTCLVMSIISSVMAVILLSIATWTMANDAQRLSEGFIFTRHFSALYRNGSYIEHDPPSIEVSSYEGRKWAENVMPVSVLFFCVAVLEVIATIWGSVICCQVLCCAEPERDQYSGVQYLPNQSQPQILVLDRHGRPLQNAQVIQIPTTSQGATIQPTGQQVQLAVQVPQPVGQVVQPVGQLAQPTGQVVPAAGEVVQPGQGIQPEPDQVQPPSYTPQQGDVNQPCSQTGEESPPPPYQ